MGLKYDRPCWYTWSLSNGWTLIGKGEYKSYYCSVKLTLEETWNYCTRCRAFYGGENSVVCSSCSDEVSRGP